MAFNKKFSSRSGQSLMELLIGMAVGSVLIIGSAAIITSSLAANGQTTSIQIQAQLGEELLNNVKSWAQGNWNALLALSTSTTSTYYLNTASSPFTVLPSSNGTTFSGGYLYTRSITVTSTVGGSNTNFPMLFSGTYSWLEPAVDGGRIQNLTTAPDGSQEPADLVFATSTANCGTADLNFETESYTPSTGAIADWVNVPTLTAGTVIYACYDNTAITADQSNPAAVWNSSYVAVYHFPGISGALTANDSTANGNNATISNATAATGTIDGAANMSASGANALTVSPSDLPLGATSPWTIEGWQDASSYTSLGIIFGFGPPEYYYQGTGNERYLIEYNNDYYFWTNNGDWDTGIPFDDNGTWHQWAFKSNGATLSFYRDGVLRASQALPGNTVSTTGQDIISGYSNIPWGVTLKASLDEERISSAALSSNWISASYNNEKSPSTFYALGGEQTAAGYYTYARPITISSNASGTNTNFPMLVSSTYSWLAASSSGGNIQNLTSVGGGGYSYSRAITVSSNASGTNSNFPMLFSNTYSWLEPVVDGGRIQNLATAPNGGLEPADLVFATSTANCGIANLNFETESYTSSTGAIVDWINVPSLTAGTVIYACYGNSAITADQSNSNATWNSNYTGVWHISEGTSNAAYDSTVNGNSGIWGGSGGGSASTYYSSGTIGTYSGYFNGSNNHIATNLDIQPSAIPTMTVSMWIYPESTSGNEDIFTDDDGGFDRGFESSRGDGNFNIFTGSGTWVPASPSLNQWQYVAVTYTPTDILFYKNGVKYDYGGAPSGQNSSLKLWIGGSPGYGEYFNGLIDETHISNTALSPSWITTEYNNQSSPFTFYTVGSEQSSPSATFQEPADLVFATSTSNCLSSPLNFETESYNSSTGAIVDWVNVPTLSAGTVIYMCYGNSAITTDQSHPAATWNSNYDAVYHLASSNGTLSSNDSTANANNGTNNGATAATGEIGGAASFDGSSNYISTGISGVPSGSSALTEMAWVDLNSSQTNSYPTIYSLDGGTAAQLGLQSNGGGGYNIRPCVTSSCYVGSRTVSTSQWTMVGFTYSGGNGGTVTTYLNGTPDSSFIGGTANVTPTQAQIDSDPSASYRMAGLIDEVNVAGAALSPSWILTEYNNENSPSTFYTIGSAQSGQSAAGSESAFINGVTFQRSFSVSDVYRDSSGNVTTTISGNLYDPSTKLVTASVNVVGSTIAPTTYSMYITRNTANYLNQITWASGPVTLKRLFPWLVQHGGMGGDSYSAQATFPLPTTSGDMITAMTLSFGCSVASITDTAGDTFQEAANSGGSGGDLYTTLWYAANITGVSNDVLTSNQNEIDSGDCYGGFFIAEWGGVATTNPLDSSSAGVGSDGYPSSTLNPNYNDLIVAAGANQNGTYPSPPGSGMTELDNDGRGIDEYALSAASPFSASLASGTAGPWSIAAAAFSPPQGGTLTATSFVSSTYAQQTNTLVNTQGGFQIFNVNNTIYNYSRSITVNASQVSSTESNFPVLFSGTYSWLAATSSGGYVQNLNGDDIIFTSDASGTTKLNWELESYNPTTGNIAAWVNIPTLTSSTEIYVFLDNPSITTFQGNTTGTWNSNFAGVWHFPTTLSGTVGPNDSTANGNNGVADNGPISAPGKIGEGIGDYTWPWNRYVEASSSASLNFGTSSFTGSAWIKMASSSTGGYDLAIGSFNADTVYLGIEPGGRAVFYDGNGGCIGSTFLADGTWHYLTGVHTATADSIYVDGVLINAIASNPSQTFTGPVGLGAANGGGGYGVNGSTDEAEISNIALSPSWILTEYNSQNSPSTFYTLGAQTINGGAGGGIGTATSTLDSLPFDTGSVSGAALNSILWQGTDPTGSTVGFQFAVGNSPNGPWNFIGPDGTNNTYYTGSPGTPINLVSTTNGYNLLTGYRYFAYRTMLSMASSVTPVVNEITVNWSP